LVASSAVGEHSIFATETQMSRGEQRVNRSIVACRPLKPSFPRVTLYTYSGVASPEIWGGKMFDFRRIKLFCLEKRLSKHKMTMFSKNFGGHGPFGLSLATPMYTWKHRWHWQ